MNQRKLKKKIKKIIIVNNNNQLRKKIIKIILVFNKNKLKKKMLQIINQKSIFNVELSLKIN